MKQKRIEKFQQEREQLNDIVLKYAQKEIKRFYSLDSQIYRDGVLPAKTKELLGLVSSLVLRCDDCVNYHLIQCHQQGISTQELEEALSIGLIVGGSITIPHLRQAFQMWDELQSDRLKFDDESKTKIYNRIEKKVDNVIESDMTRDEKLHSVCRVLDDEIPYFDWVGFYLVDPGNPDELILGPFVGEPTEHVRIPVGKGICGQAAERKETFLIQDVSQETNYLSCSPSVKSEIVVPLLKDGQVLGELDIDSHNLAPFSDVDQKYLEKICEKLAEVIF